MYSPKFLLFSCLLLTCFFTSCEKRGRFSNTFKGGYFSMTVYDCDNETLLHGEERIVKRTKHSISIKGYGPCLQDGFVYTFDGKAKVKKNLIKLKIEYDERHNPDVKGSGEVNECVCPCEMVFSFDEAISEKIPYETKWKKKEASK